MSDEYIQICNHQLLAMLCIPHDASAVQVHNSIVNGFSSELLNNLCNTGDITTHERNQIISHASLRRRLSKGQRLTNNESERLFRVAQITIMAQEVFGDRDKAKRWLSKPKGRFNGQTPTMLLLTLPGTCLVEEMLRQIAEGYSF